MTTGAVEARTERYARAAALLRQWLSDAEHEDDADYDWPAIDVELLADNWIAARGDMPCHGD